MDLKSRQSKIFAALFVSMTACSVLFMALGQNPPSAGAFCLNSYYSLEPVEQVIGSQEAQYTERWDAVEVCYSGTDSGNVAELAGAYGCGGAGRVNFHFCVYNGRGGADGAIRPTARWQKQLSVLPGERFDGQHADRPCGRNIREDQACSRRGGGGPASLARTIRICVVGNGRSSPPSDYQLKRTEALVEALCTRFDIADENVFYPENWR